MLGRQWQLGEFEGEDAGTPLTVRVVTNSTAVDRWAAGDSGAVRGFGRTTQEVLEPFVEREPAGTQGPGLRARAEAAAVLMAALDDAGLAAYRETFTANCPLDLDPGHPPDGGHAALDPSWVRLTRLLSGRGLADAELICDAVENGLAPWLPDDAALADVLEPWVRWYRAEVSPEPGGCWSPNSR